MAKYRLLVVVVLALLAAVTAWVVNGVLQEGEVTPNDEFFTLSIGKVPDIDADAWTLVVDGLVLNSTTLSYNDILAMPSVVERETLKCVEGPSGTADWRGVPLSAILDLVGVREGAVDVVFHAADGYSSSLDLEDAMEPDVLLCYEMNGEPLPRVQGFPLRVVSPGKAGYKWVKWVERVEVVNYDHKGYWESRGWDDEADLAVWADWAPHAILLTLAAFLGTFSALSGLKFSRETTFWRDLPEWFTRGLHTRTSWAFFALLYVVFAYWSVTTLIRRGGLFYSSHGLLALVSVSLLTVGLVTGHFLERGSERLRTAHLFANVLGYLLLLGTIALGLVRI